MHYYNLEFSEICTPEEVTSNRTIGIVQTTSKVGSLCRNVVPLVGYMECVGDCRTPTKYNPSKIANLNNFLKIIWIHLSKFTCSTLTIFHRIFE